MKEFAWDNTQSLQENRSGRSDAGTLTPLDAGQVISGPTLSQGAFATTSTAKPAVDDARFTPTGSLISLLFDETSYIEMHFDLKHEKEVNPDFDAVHHFNADGRSEGRCPSYFFDVEYVVQRTAKLHGLEIPRCDALSYFESLPPGQRFVPNRWFVAGTFRLLYAERYPEIAGATDYNLFIYYLLNAAADQLSPSGLFNEAAYVARNKDVAAAIASDDERSGFMHYLTKGCYEGRVNLPGLLRPGAPDGLEERRLLLGKISDFDWIVWWFDEGFYLSVYPDVHNLKRRGQITSGLEHFLLIGFRQGLIPHPAAFKTLQHLAMSDKRRNDGWALATLLAEWEKMPQQIGLHEATKLLAFLNPSPARRPQVLAALWPFIEPPVLGGTCDVPNYVALNPSLEAIWGSEYAQHADHHWRRHGVHERRPSIGSNLYNTREITLQDVVNWKSGVNFFGPLSLASGLGSSARAYVAALRHAGIQVAAYDVSSLVKEGVAAEIFCSEELPFSINFFLLNADQIEPFTAKYGTEIFNHRANVACWVWELPAPRIEWRVALSAIDLILAPTQFCADSFATITSRPIRVVPHAVQRQELEAAPQRPIDNEWLVAISQEKAAGRKIVLFVMDASSYVARKGLDLFIALTEEIEKERPGECLFVLKSHSRDLSNPVVLPVKNKPILVIDEVWEFETLCQLRSLTDVYVSPHRSEGFGLNIVEAVMMGVPTLCSASQAIVERLGETYPYLIRGRPAEVGRDMGPYAAGAIWFEPDPADLRAKLLSMLDGPIDPRFAEASMRLAEELSLTSIGQTLKRELKTYCALDAKLVQSFMPIAAASKDEVYRLGFVDKTIRRTPDAPGQAQIAAIAAGAAQPFFSIITPAYDSDPVWLNELYDDLLHQTFLQWEWCIADDCSLSAETKAALQALRRRDSRIKLVTLAANVGIAAATNAAVSISIGRYLVMIDHDDRVSPDLLSAYAERIADEVDQPGLLYCDEDKIDADGMRCESYCKPDWSPEHITSSMYVLHCLCIRKQTFLELGGYRSDYDGAQDHDFVLRAASSGAPIVHVDQILYHWRIGATSTAATAGAKRYAIEAGRRAVADYADRIGVSATVDHGYAPGTYRIRPTLPTDPVSVLILTGLTKDPRDPEGRSYAENFVRSILRHPPEIDFTIDVVVDSQVMDQAGGLLHIDPRVRVVPYTPVDGVFNFAHKANAAIRGAAADRVVLLNDDMQARNDQWLAALLEVLELPGVGVVGGRLLYQDGKVQHSGIVLGVNGACTHIFMGMPPGHNGYNQYPHLIRNYSAVTGAMLAFRRSVFNRVRGFDVGYPIDFNDVDFCLRVQDAGLRIVYTPFAELLHFESCSAVRLAADALDTRRFEQRWGKKIGRDPYYNRNLSRSGFMCDDLVPLTDQETRTLLIPHYSVAAAGVG